AAIVKSVRLMRRYLDRRGPLEAVLQVGRSLCIRDFRRHGDVFDLSSAFVETSDISLVIPGVNNIGIGRIRRDISGFPTAHRIPVGAPYGSVIIADGDSDRAVVLLCAIHVIRRSGIGNHMVELRRGLIVLSRPGLPTTL